MSRLLGKGNAAAGALSPTAQLSPTAAVVTTTDGATGGSSSSSSNAGDVIARNWKLRQAIFLVVVVLVTACTVVVLYDATWVNIDNDSSSNSNNVTIVIGDGNGSVGVLFNGSQMDEFIVAEPVSEVLMVITCDRICLLKACLQ